MNDRDERIAEALENIRDSLRYANLYRYIFALMAIILVLLVSFQ